MIISFAGRAAVVLAASGLAVVGAVGPVHAVGGTSWQVEATIAPNNEEVQLNIGLTWRA